MSARIWSVVSNILFAISRPFYWIETALVSLSQRAALRSLKASGYFQRTEQELRDIAELAARKKDVAKKKDDVS